MNPEQGHSASAPGVVLDDNDPGRGNAVDRRQALHMHLGAWMHAWRLHQASIAASLRAYCR